MCLSVLLQYHVFYFPTEKSPSPSLSAPLCLGHVKIYFILHILILVTFSDLPQWEKLLQFSLAEENKTLLCPYINDCSLRLSLNQMMILFWLVGTSLTNHNDNFLRKPDFKYSQHFRARPSLGDSDKRLWDRLLLVVNTIDEAYLPVIPWKISNFKWAAVSFFSDQKQINKLPVCGSQNCTTCAGPLLALEWYLLN